MIRSESTLPPYLWVSNESAPSCRVIISSSRRILSSFGSAVADDGVPGTGVRAEVAIDVDGERPGIGGISCSRYVPEGPEIMMVLLADFLLSEMVICRRCRFWNVPW